MVAVVVAASTVQQEALRCSHCRAATRALTALDLQEVLDTPAAGITLVVGEVQGARAFPAPTASAVTVVQAS